MTTEAAAAPSLWQGIHRTLTDEIAAGRYPAGVRLPTEAELARRFAVNRHTVRRALAALRDEGRVHIRRGAGAFVTTTRLDYAIGPRTRFSQNLAAAGQTPGRDFLRIETLPADATEAERLELPKRAQVHIVEAVSQADGVPLTYSRAAFPAARLPDLPEALRAEGSITAALARCGVDDYHRRWTRLTAERPTALIARHLRMPESHPVLRAESLNTDAEGRPMEYGVSWFCSDRVQLVVDRTSFS